MCIMVCGVDMMWEVVMSWDQMENTVKVGTAHLQLWSMHNMEKKLHFLLTDSHCLYDYSQFRMGTGRLMTARICYCE